MPQAAAGFWRAKLNLPNESTRQLNSGQYECTYYTGGGGSKVALCGIKNAGHTTGAYAPQGVINASPSACCARAVCCRFLCTAHAFSMRSSPALACPPAPDIPYVGAPFDLTWETLRGALK